MELIIYNPQIPELIKFNNAELIAELTEKLGHYNNLTYTDTEIKTAKTDRATLRKFKEAIEERRKEIKVDCMKPYNAVSYTHLRAHETRHDLVCRLLLEKKKKNIKKQ